MFNLSPTSFDPTDALCAEVDPELFFPENNRAGYANLKQAKSICNSCSIISECLAEALSKPDLVGIWGGTSDAERRLLRRKASWKTGVITTEGKTND